MKKLLIIKIGASGDVLRTTALLHLFKGWQVDWFVARENRDLLLNDCISNILEEPDVINRDTIYDLVINLEDDEAVCRSIFARLSFTEVFGSFIDKEQRLCYTDNSADWFDLGLISKHGIEKANELKLRNRNSYQKIIYRCLGYAFEGQEYIMPNNIPNSDLKGDIAIAPDPGEKWPMKKWHHLNDLARDLSKNYVVNTLPRRKAILDHIADIRQHKFVISPDSLPMHISLGLRIPCAAVFTCTSPWEIYDYGLLTKIVSPKLEQYFYSREFDEDAVTCIPYEESRELILEKLRSNGI